ncbi:unnamed protein product [Adineta ricciae]|uniref:Dynamin-type G domain-containing protein n=2 Tax=Adineta ricciae TaxID=249248 RepID=A0A815GAG3_ADIRI|nr:unnamed protein product [Adineta ricciae]
MSLKWENLFVQEQSYKRMNVDGNSFTDAYDDKVRPIMDKIDQIRSLLSTNNDGVTFPNVVVVGDQSSGKSTLLEALSLVELPKGSGIVTRCPLVLRLRRSNRRQVYRILENNKKDVLDETQLDILKYIEEETKKIAGSNKNVVDTLIELLVEDPNVRDLTVVDLPGIARNPIGDQPKDIHQQTTKLIKKFISQEGSVILCVFPANVDIATVESFTLAREFDPDGVRTIGVITKSDLATNNETLIQQLLMEKEDVFKLTLGFVAVRNRSTDERISLVEARQREKDFFQSHSVLPVVGWDCLGIEALINRLANLYSDRVKEIFPKMRNDIQKKMKEVREQLSNYPADLDTPAARLAKYYELAEFYVENMLKIRFSSSYDNKHTSMINTLHNKFAKYNDIVNSFTKELFTTSYHEKVRLAIASCVGEQLPNFLPHPILKRLIGDKLDQLWKITDILINECYHLAEKLLLDQNLDEHKGHVLLMKLIPAFRNVVSLYLKEKNQLAHHQLQEMIRLEKHDPYTMHNSYLEKLNEFQTNMKAHEASKSTVKNSSPPEIKFREDDDELMFKSAREIEQTTREMLFSIYAYWKVLVKRFMDYTALTLRAGCDFDVCTGIKERLRHIPMEQCDFVDSYLAEDASTLRKRKQLQQTKERLEKVDAILGGRASIDTIGNYSFIDMNPFDNDSMMTLDKFEQNINTSSSTATSTAAAIVDTTKK